MLGLDLDLEEGAWNGLTPLDGFVAVKALSEDGKICYVMAATKGLKSVECLGMARYAMLKLEHGLIAELGERG